MLNPLKAGDSPVGNMSMSSSSRPSAPRSGSAAAACPPCTRPSCSARFSARSSSARGIDPAEVGQVVGGCVSQVGEQTFNITRTAWLAAGLPMTVAATTVDTQCGSSASRPPTSPPALVGGGVVDVAIACGVESMSRIPIGSTRRQGARPRRPAAEDLLRAATRRPRSSRAPSASPTSGASPATTPTRSVSPRSSAPPRRGPRTASTASAHRRRARRRRGGQAHRHHAHRRRATKACARPRSRSSRRSSRSPARTASTPPATRRRSPTAPPPC